MQPAPTENKQSQFMRIPTDIGEISEYINHQPFETNTTAALILETFKFANPVKAQFSKSKVRRDKVMQLKPYQDEMDLFVRNKRSKSSMINEARKGYISNQGPIEKKLKIELKHNNSKSNRTENLP